MTDLQTAYYIIGIVFMSLMLLIGLISVIAVLVIRSKIVAIHKQVEERLNTAQERLNTAQEWAEKSEAVLGAIKKVATKTKR